jgi:hypothetical protein
MPPENSSDADSIDNSTQPDTTAERDCTMSDVLKWVGFDAAEQKILLGQLGNELRMFLNITAKELDQLSKELSGTSAGTDKMKIGFMRMRLLKGVIYWAMDKQRLGMTVTMIVDTGDEATAQFEFLEELNTSIDRQAIRVQSTDSIEAMGKAASPGKLKDEKNWDKWEQGLYLMLSILRGVNGVPLSYVIREKEHKAGDIYNSFLKESIAKVSLKGPQFEADSRTVHAIIETLTSGENAAHWLTELKNKDDGRKDMAALQAHYRGAGNQSRRISNAQGLQVTLHYKNERAMKFSDFISKAKEMFDIFTDCKEPQTESVKLRFLWEKIDSAILQTPMEIMKADLSRDADSWTFVTACDHLASLIPADGKSVTFKASAIESGKGAATSSIMRNGKIFTGTYPKEEWFDVLTKDERDQVMTERKKGGKSHFDRKKKPTNERKIQALEKQLKKSKKTISKSKKTISSMKRSTKEEDDDASDSDSSTDGDNAGNAFGGRAEKQRQKKKKPKISYADEKMKTKRTFSIFNRPFGQLVSCRFCSTERVSSDGNTCMQARK